MLVFAVALTLATGVGFGVLPVLRAAGSGDLDGLREGARRRRPEGAAARRRWSIAEIVASVVLLVSAGLLMRALWRVQRIDPGFRAEGVLTLRTALPMPQLRRPRHARERSTRRVLRRGARAARRRRRGVHQLPADDVRRRHLARCRPNGRTRADGSDGYNARPALRDAGVLRRRSASRSCRDGTSRESDAADRPFVAVVSASFAKRLLADGTNPIGRRFAFAFQERDVVGVAGDVRVRGLERPSEPQVYLSYLQQPRRRGPSTGRRI